MKTHELHLTNDMTEA